MTTGTIKLFKLEREHDGVSPYSRFIIWARSDNEAKEMANRACKYEYTDWTVTPVARTSRPSIVMRAS